MRQALAERLLAEVMDWSPADVARERPVLQALAALKYDEYEQFSPGMRFVESLALWVSQFNQSERADAYDFVRERLIFLSQAEMTHFATVVYPDLIRPLLIQRAAEAEGLRTFEVARTVASQAFRRVQETALFLALSDGARVDQFRRSNRELSHEQIFPSYELPKERLDSFREWVAGRGFQENRPVPAVVLLDDFAGSGKSYIRSEQSAKKGKIVKLLTAMAADPKWKALVSFPETLVVVGLYVASDSALTNLRHGLEDLAQDLKFEFRLVCAQTIPANVVIGPASPLPIVPLAQAYYDPQCEDEHTAKGGTDLRFGFAGCGLPLVLHHNTPNNSLFILWAEPSQKVTPLFPRFSRHKADVS